MIVWGLNTSTGTFKISQSKQYINVLMNKIADSIISTILSVFMFKSHFLYR